MRVREDHRHVCEHCRAGPSSSRWRRERAGTRKLSGPSIEQPSTAIELLHRVRLTVSKHVQVIITTIGTGADVSDKLCSDHDKLRSDHVGRCLSSVLHARMNKDVGKVIFINIAHEARSEAALEDARDGPVVRAAGKVLVDAMANLGLLDPRQKRPEDRERSESN